METLPDPTWNVYFGISGKKIVIAPNELELQSKAKEFKFTKAACLGRIGIIGANKVHEIFQGKMTPAKNKLFVATIGIWPTHSWNEVMEKGFKYPTLLPAHGCFGFINGNLILGNRHHQEIMYRLISEKGWTWEQLVDAEQCWGWYYQSSNGGTVRFSSDAGTMTSKKVKTNCKAEFASWFDKPFKVESGYGGKSKETYGGNMEMKYGKVGQWGGTRASLDTTIITALPDPPEEDSK